jgi:hypothetical protein
MADTAKPAPGRRCWRSRRTAGLPDHCSSIDGLAWTCQVLRIWAQRTLLPDTVLAPVLEGLCSRGGAAPPPSAQGAGANAAFKCGRAPALARGHRAR